VIPLPDYILFISHPLYRISKIKFHFQLQCHKRYCVSTVCILLAICFPCKIFINKLIWWFRYSWNCPVVTLSSTVFGIFDFEKCWNEVSYIMSYSNFVSKMHHFLMFIFEKSRDLETQVSSYSRSLEMTPVDRLHMTSYSYSYSTVAYSVWPKVSDSISHETSYKWLKWTKVLQLKW